MERKVVITGLGVVSALGTELDKFWNNIINSKSGISKITKFDVSDFPSKIGAEIKD
ncbi:MAG: beta-ketoacyl synthase N-terminal-like domain-containing protein, partial [Bacillota bacterium]